MEKLFYILLSLTLLVSCSHKTEESTLTYTARLTKGSIIRSTEVNVELTCSDMNVIVSELQGYTDLIQRVSVISQMMNCN